MYSCCTHFILLKKGGFGKKKVSTLTIKLLMLGIKVRLFFNENCPRLFTWKYSWTVASPTMEKIRVLYGACKKIHPVSHEKFGQQIQSVKNGYSNRRKKITHGNISVFGAECNQRPSQIFVFKDSERFVLPSEDGCEQIPCNRHCQSSCSTATWTTAILRDHTQLKKETKIRYNNAIF